MTYNLFDLNGHEWHSIRTLDGARKKAYSLIDGHAYRSTVFVYNGTRYLGTVQWFRTVEDSDRNIYKPHIVYVSGKNIWRVDNDGTLSKTYFGNETIRFVSGIVADSRREFHSNWKISKKR